MWPKRMGRCLTFSSKLIGECFSDFPGLLLIPAQRGRESFNTHVWMLKTLLGQSVDSQKSQNAFLLYIIAISFEKMNRRMMNELFSAPYKACLLEQKTFAFVKLPFAVPNVVDSNRDRSFIGSIPLLVKATAMKIPNLKQAANLLQPIYNECTYMEFHLLLCKLLMNFSNSLENLHTKRYHRKETGNCNLKEILEALKQVEVFRHYLRTMVRSSAIETHLQTIAQFLVVDTKKSWTFEPEGDADFADFHPLNPYSMCTGKALLPWELHRDWLRLMVYYFDAAKLLTSFFRSLELHHLPTPTICITILSPPLPDHEMLTWTELLGTEHFFLTVPGGLLGKDFIEFLQTNDSYKDSPMRKNVKDVIESAQRLIKKLKSDLLIPRSIHLLKR